MSGKNMRLSSLALSSFTTRSSSSWIESLRRKKSDSASSPSGGADKPLKGWRPEGGRSAPVVSQLTCGWPAAKRTASVSELRCSALD